MKYLSINEPHLPTDLLNKGSAASSRGNRGPVGCVHIRSWAPGWPSVAPQQVSEPFFVSTVQISDFLPASRRATFWMNSSPTPLQIPPLRGRGGMFLAAFTPLLTFVGLEAVRREEGEAGDPPIPFVIYPLQQQLVQGGSPSFLSAPGISRPRLPTPAHRCPRGSPPPGAQQAEDGWWGKPFP